MGELREEQVVGVNPYVVQMDKFVSSLEKLSNIFLRLEKRKMILQNMSWKRCMKQ